MAGINLDQRPNWTQTNQGDAFQFTEVYQAPGMESVTDITRTESTSIYRYHNYLLAITLVGNPVFANVSNTSAPVAQCSSSVSNFATQVLGGRW